MRTRSVALITAAVALAAPAAAGAADAGPQQQTIAYSKYFSTKPSQVWTISQGAAPKKVSGDAFSPVVSPRGDLVAYQVSTRSSYRIVVAKTGGGTVRTLAKDAVGGVEPVWSPDQSQLAAVVGPEIGKQSLVLITVADASRRVVATGYFSGASFAPGGTQLAYGRSAKDTSSSAKDVWVAPVAGGTPVNVTKDGKSISPVWGPSQIAFSHLAKPARKNDYPKANLQAINGDGTGRKTLTKVKIPYLLAGLYATAWSADGTRLLAEFGGQDYSEAWTVDLKTGKARDLTGKEDGVLGFGISADGSRVLAATGGYDPGDTHNLVTIPFTGGKAKIVVKNGSYATWAGF